MISILAMMLAPTFYLHSGDRVVFYGDSITEQKLYTTYVEAFVATRYPALDITFFNRGWSGDSSWGGGGGTADQRVAMDVAPLKPSVITVMLGMNDSGYVAYDPKIESTILSSYGHLIDKLATSDPGARLTFIRTSPWDDFAHSYARNGHQPNPWAPWGGYNDVIRRYGKIVEDEAAKRKSLYVDFNVPLSNVLTAAHQKDAVTAVQIIPDSIHPGPAGHLVMAAELLKGWGAEGLVSAVEIDAAHSKVVTSERTQISDLSGLGWTQTDESLPFFIDRNDKTVDLTRELSGFTEILNRQALKVSGLDSGRYELSIDGQKVGEFSSDDLGKGLELSLFDTPMHRQSLEVLNLVERRVGTEFFAWRSVQRESKDVDGADAAYDALEKLVEGLRQKIRATAKPVARHYLLKKVG